MSSFPAETIARSRVLVVGDVMLDRYWFGEVERISPEAPVPVVRVARREDRLGGAANVARNVAALGGHVTLIGVLGEDEAGASVRKLAREAGIEGELIVDPTLHHVEDARARPPAAVAPRRFRAASGNGRA